MQKIEWEDAISVGIEEIDNQHKILIELINELSRAISHQTEYILIPSIIEDLIDYAIYHFDAEEEYARKQKSPHLKAHRLIHDEFTQQILDYVNGEQDENFPIELLGFLKHWLVNHIRTDDRLLLKPDMVDC